MGERPENSEGRSQKAEVRKRKDRGLRTRPPMAAAGKLGRWDVRRQAGEAGCWDARRLGSQQRKNEEGENSEVRRRKDVRPAKLAAGKLGG